MAHVQTSQLRASQWHGAQLAPYAAEGASLASSSRALAPMRGVLLGSALGLGCWALVGTLFWVLL